MSQSSKPQKLRTNAALACNNCRASHRKCKKPSEEDICAYCRNHRLHCTYTLGGKRGPKPRFSKLRSPFNSSFHKPNIEEFQFFSLNFGTSHLYNDVITTPFRTTEVFINKEPTPNYQNITPINPNKANIEEFQSSYSNFETTYAYTTPSFKTTETFIGQGLMSNNNSNTTSINSYESATEEFQFCSLNHPYYNTIITPSRTTEAFINNEPALNDQNITPINLYKTTNEEFQSSYLNFEITHAQTIGTTEAFIDQGLMLNNPNTTPFNSYEIATEEFQSPY
ncbi:8498_t:CDS:1 [Cetraspora pellucida]|uniref:8498_t:CDS:1 n=1 Tax=Cetraspora pellucida TaxID=1433469 RepID=A0ACA9KMX7_9GLOM|nr:8498_t:CDS:1 [Cetraspora pellucida]